MIKLTWEKKSKTKAAVEQEPSLAKEQTEALVESILSAGNATKAAGVSAPSADSGPRPHQAIKLGIDVHLDRYVVMRQMDGGAPQPPQRFGPTQFLDWVKKQTQLAKGGEVSDERRELNEFRQFRRLAGSDHSLGW